MTEQNDTKLIIAEGFRRLMEKKPFAKITISDITDESGFNRQTFYYHFHDKYDLLNWIFYREMITPFVEGLSFDNWSAKLLTMLSTIKDNSRFYSNALKTSYGDEFHDYIQRESSNVFSDVIDDIAGKGAVSPEDKRFIAEFFSFGIVGTVLKWVRTDMKESPKVIVSHIENLVNDCKRLAISRYLGAASQTEEG